MAVAPGLRVGRYEVGSKLGQGGFGIIYVGRDTELDRDVALKFLRPEHVTRPDVVMRFLQEARSAAKINHPGIVTVFECGQVTGTNTRADGTVYIAMELLAGESLSARLKRERLLPPAMALGITRQLCAALQAAHLAGIVHRDLKPDNIFLVPDPAMRDGTRVKILDFGVAKLADGQFSGGVRTHSAMVLGTPTYMSPEQCKSSAKVDHRSDIYAVGCILYELLCGARPYDGDAGEQIAKHQLAPVPVPRAVNPEIPAPLDQLVTQMLAKNPDERPGSMELVDDALAVLERAPTAPAAAARSGSLPPAPPPPGAVSTMFEDEHAPTKVTEARTSRWTLIGGAAGVIVLGVILGVVCTRTTSSDRPATAPRAKDAAVVVVAPDAAAVVVFAPPEIDAAVPVTIDDVKMECLKLAADKRWTDLLSCTDRLATSDPTTAKSLRAKAVIENKADIAARTLADSVKAGDLKQAKLELAKIPADSVYRVDAKALYDEAVRAANVPTTTVARPTTAKSTAPPPADCDAKALQAKGEDHLTSGMDAAALAAFEASLACAPSGDVERLAFTAACRSRSAAKAKLHYARLPRATVAAIVQICVRNGIDPTDAECDADELRDKGQEHLQTGMDAAALAAFEASMKCRPDAGLLRLAFMAACRSKNVAKAKYYYPKLPQATTTGITQICKRNGIQLP